MRAAAATAIPVVLALACGSAGRPGAPGKHTRHIDRSGDRIRLHIDPTATFGTVRQELIDAMETGAHSLDMLDDKGNVTVELPSTAALDDPTDVVVVRVDAAAHVGTTRVADTRALEGVVWGQLRTETIVLLRVADGIDLRQVTAVARVVQGARPAHLVMGLVRAREAPPLDGWEICPFPPQSDVDGVDHGTATLMIEWDDEARPGVIRVAESSGHGFGGAAVICALRQKSSTSRCSGAPPCTQRLRVNFVRP